MLFKPALHIQACVHCTVKYVGLFFLSKVEWLYQLRVWLKGGGIFPHSLQGHSPLGRLFSLFLLGLLATLVWLALVLQRRVTEFLGGFLVIAFFPLA